jgi:hypothetical protein
MKGCDQMCSVEKREKPLKGIRREELLVPFLVVIFSISYITQVWGAPRVVVLWPYIVMALLLICTVAVVIEGLAGGWRHKDLTDASGPGALAWLRKGVKPLIISGVTIIYLAAFERMGFTLANLLYLMTLFWALGTRRARVIVGISLIIAVVLHLAMINFLQMPVPRLSLPFTTWEL